MKDETFLEATEYIFSTHNSRRHSMGFVTSTAEFGHPKGVIDVVDSVEGGHTGPQRQPLRLSKSRRKRPKLPMVTSGLLSSDGNGVIQL